MLGAAEEEILLVANETRGDAMTQQTQPVDPVAVHSDAGEARWWSDGLAVIKATAADTAGQMTILEITEPANCEAPLHVHHGEDEGFWILEGSATFEVGGETIEAHAGDYLFGPRDIPHRYTTGPDGCRMLFIFTPGGFEELLRATSRPATSRTLPPAAAAAPSDEEMRRMRAALEAHGCELLG
jgi:quercetin dioxygenase-like cupin family protein